MTPFLWMPRLVNHFPQVILSPLCNRDSLFGGTSHQHITEVMWFSLKNHIISPSRKNDSAEAIKKPHGICGSWKQSTMGWTILMLSSISMAYF
jgi:hypothetical protein